MRLVLALSVVAACKQAPATAPDAPPIAVDGSPDAANQSGFDVHVFETGQTAGLAGATVCVVGQSDCETTNANGDAAVTVAGNPYDLSLAFSATKAGHLTIVELGRVYTQLDVFVHTVPSDLGLLNDADASAFFTAAGLAYPATTTGFVRATVLDGAAPGAEQGATVTLDHGGTAIYLDASGRPDPTLTAIGPGGGVLFGNVPAGPFSITVHATNTACITQTLAWDGDGTTSASGVVVAGALTDAITLACYATK
jgi:hypothetical protein